MIGTEHEFSINSAGFLPLPAADEIIRSACGRFRDEIPFGEVRLGKELQKSVLEFVPKEPSGTIAGLELQLLQGLFRFRNTFKNRYTLLGLGMHPTLTLDQTAVWDHGEGEYYRVYDRLFNIRQHGWLNIQALQINLSYGSEKELVRMYNRTRILLPYLVAVTAASPFVEGAITPFADNRLLFYRQNQKEIPLICNGIVPGPIRAIRDYRRVQEEVFMELRARDAGILCEEWVNSAGMIIRFSRQCLEIKAIDEQECIRSDMAVAAFIRSLLRCDLSWLPADQKTLRNLLEEAIARGTFAFGEELPLLYRAAWERANPDEQRYLPVIRDRIEHGSLAERIQREARRGCRIETLLPRLASCLTDNRPFQTGKINR